MRPFPLLITAASLVAAVAGASSSNTQNGQATTLKASELKLSGTANAAVTTTQGSSLSASAQVRVIEFENVGYTGYYYDVKSISNAETSACACSLSSTFTVFEGSNSPLDEELSVHFRGPLSLKLFGYYLASDSSSGSWSRYAYYNASEQTADNVTFLNNAGTASTCLGKALSYSLKNGTGYSSLSNILESDNLVESNEEYAIYSNLSCPSSGFSNACGVYRTGIPAYHGFGGTTKLFLFEFTMPDTEVTNTSTTYYNMPAIWFLNAKIARTSQYATSSSCSCWNSGCGELDAFEVVNKTYPYQLASTIHDYQGTDNVNLGMAASAYFTRNTGSVMKGGVRFGTDGTISIFLLDDLSLNSSIDASTVSKWISNAGTEGVKALSSVTMNTSATSAALSSKKSGGNTLQQHGWMSTVFTFILLALIYL